MATTEVTYETVEVTPELAAEWLAKNTHNRNIRQRQVTAYARDMAQGMWRMTGEPVKFAHDGTLLDGQHRLMAVLRADVPVRFAVARGLDLESQDNMDSGIKRQFGDVLHLKGYKLGHLLAATARLGLFIETSGSESTTVDPAYSNAELDGYLLANEPDITEAVARAQTLARWIDLAPSVLAYTIMATARQDPDQSATFFESLANNETAGRGDPRNTLLQRLSVARRTGTSIPKVTQYQFVMRAWQAWNKGAELKLLRGRPIRRSAG